jgi:hypothetical protein
LLSAFPDSDPVGASHTRLFSDKVQHDD